jgi:methionine synthase / methylenetetrahydrofolate reductase(NADPH)
VKRSFSEVLKDDMVIVCDGAKGTLLYSQGVSVGNIISSLNVSNPQIVLDVHKAYLQAGAKVIETNTFDANHVKLSQLSLEDQLYEINSKGAKLVREAVGDKAYVAGSIGPLGKPLAPVGAIKEKSARWMYKEQITALYEGGVDLIILETFMDLDELLLAVETAKKHTDLPVFGMLTFIDAETTSVGQTPAQGAAALERVGCDVVGTNCGGGPSVALQVVKEMKEVTSLPLSVFPNASIPEYRHRMFHYDSEFSYFAGVAEKIVAEGVKFIGGCCGTTPLHIEALSRLFMDRKVRNRTVRPKVIIEPIITRKSAVGRPSPFAERLAKKFVVTVEVDPPKGKDYQDIVKEVKTLKDLGVDAINVADNPLAKVRMSSIIFAHIIKERIGIDTILHLTTRDKNVLGLQSDLFGASALGIDNLLIMRGDLSREGDYPWATNVFDVTPSGLAEIISKMNLGMDLAGNSINKPTNFFIGVVANPHAQNLAKEIKMLRRKLENGGNFIITQPIYDVETIKRFMAALAPNKIPILAGILPLISKGQAEFLHNEVPGIRIPEQIRKRIASLTEDEVEKEGIDHSAEVADKLRNIVAGIYIIPPAKRFDVVTTLVKKIKNKE